LIKWQEDKNISIGLSFLKATVTDIGDKRVLLRTTSIEFPNGKTTTKEKENIRKFTIHQIKEYLALGKNISLEKLEQLSAYRKFRDSVKEAFEKLNYL